LDPTHQILELRESKINNDIANTIRAAATLQPSQIAGGAGELVSSLLRIAEQQVQVVHALTPRLLQRMEAEATTRSLKNKRRWPPLRENEQYDVAVREARSDFEAILQTLTSVHAQQLRSVAEAVACAMGARQESLASPTQQLLERTVPASVLQMLGLAPG
jgi:hypothetical protein